MLRARSGNDLERLFQQGQSLGDPSALATGFGEHAKPVLIVQAPCRGTRGDALAQFHKAFPVVPLLRKHPAHQELCVGDSGRQPQLNRDFAPIL